MTVIETRIDVERSAADVFAFVSDQTNAPQWQHGLDDVRRTTGGPLGVGTEHVFVRRFAGRRIESRNRFVRFEPGRYVAFAIPDGRITGEASYLVEPTGPESCRLTSQMEFEFSGLVGLAAPLLRQVLKRDTARDEATLKTLLEAQTPSS